MCFEAAALLADGDQFDEERREAIAVRFEGVFERFAFAELVGDVGGQIAERPRPRLSLLPKDANGIEPGAQAMLEDPAPRRQCRQRAL